VLVEIGSVGEFSGPWIDRDNGALKAALVEEEVVGIDVIESGIAKESVANEIGVAIEEG